MLTVKQYQTIQNEMRKKRSVKRFNKNDVLNILDAKTSGEWSSVHSSKFYKEHGGDYCTLLEVLNKVV